MKWTLLGVFLWCVLLTGCRQQQAPEYDALECQLLIEALDALSGNDPARAVRALQRLDDTRPGLEFVQIAIEDEREREILKYANGKLAEGNTAQLGREIRERAASANGFRSWDKAAELVTALEALKSYLSGSPYSQAAAMEASLQNLVSFEDVLGKSDVYNQFIEGQREILSEKKKAEALSALGRMFQSLDEAVVSGSPEAVALIRNIAETEAGSFVLLLDGALSAGSSHALENVLDSAPKTKETRMATEILGWLRRDHWNRSVAKMLLENMDLDNPLSRSGKLFKARICVGKHDLPQALALARSALRGLSPSSRDVESFIRKSILSPEQFDAWCWASPCPGLSEFLVRLEQIRRYQSLSGGK